MNLDRQLREALARRSPPRDLVAEVIAKLGSPHESRPTAPAERWLAVFARPTRLRAFGASARRAVARVIAGERRRKGRAYALAAATIVVISIGFGVARQRAANEERRRGELATRQLMTALQIASETLNDAQRLVKQAY